MVSKTKRQRQRRKRVLEENGGVPPPVVPSERKHISLKKTRPRMKSKAKIRLGHECPINIYDGFEERKGVLWRCPKCSKECRVVGFCVDCATGKKSRSHTGVTMSRSKVAKKAETPPATLSAVKKKLKLRKK
ncbi:hypothetical protein ERJ75_001653900 [Trypanosoma vivax]|uniref:Uncharacterized protein n=1 Tax=Trypanosoma vivax (strain Y486) TaxID=1055687 RepID=G0U9G9_TRYVY|nr:hypothetical protein TRVL_09091 [Trypanosoma vivax]KAH8605183.1 hypothetical protein ERJ75_001653900 [Trypanosoma vivax]CCC54255.1 conserved hypothetical protein [Trypanosoma vivax Y486]